MNGELIPWIDRARAGGWLTAVDEARVRGELWAMLAGKAEVLSLGDSSIRTERAEELLRSLCFTVSLALEPLPEAEAASKLAARPLRSLYLEGSLRLDRRLARAKAAYERALKESLPFENLAYRDTLESLGGFFRAYRPDLFAHDIPCMIDYPLYREARGLGAVYIEQYLAEWRLENAFLSKFPFERVTRLLNACFVNAREQVVNLFEPVAANALGLALAGGDPLTLTVPAEARGYIRGMRRTLEASEFRKRLAAAADDLSRRLGADGALLQAAAAELAGRLLQLPPEGMAGVFTAV